MKKLTPLFVVGLLMLGCDAGGNSRQVGTPMHGNAGAAQNKSAPSPQSTSDVLADAPVFDASGEPDGTRNFYFVLDGSGSMKDGCGGKKKIDGLKRAVEQFMGNVPSDANIGAIVFDTRGIREVVPLGPNNHTRFLQAVREMQAQHGTPLGETIALASKKLEAQYKQQQGYGEYRLIVVTDGEATDDLDSGLRMADSRNIPIYTIGFCIPGGHSLAQHSASYADANSEAELKVALSRTVAELDVFDPTVFDEKTVSKVQMN